MAISPTSPPSITTLPAAPNSATDSPSEFDAKANNTVAAQVSMIPEINTANDWVETTATQVYGNALEAKSSAESAEISARANNFYGSWSLLTGALNKPATVLHNDIFWLLNVNLANVALSEPSFANADWTAALEQTVILTGGIYQISDATGITDGYQINFIRQKGITNASVQTIAGTFKTDKGNFDEITVGEMYGFTATCINQVWEV